MSLVCLPVVSRASPTEALPPAPDGFGAHGLPLLTDVRGRRITYLRLSVTDRCDLACQYCMPPCGEAEHATRKELLTFEEAARLVHVFSAVGIRRVRFTGGEPLIRKDFLDLVSLVRSETGISDLALTSNATRLPELARPLAAAGLRAVNISLDSLDADRFRQITRGGDLARVLRGIHASLDAGLTVKINTVALRGVNDHELGRLVDFAWGLGITPRFIELMPLGAAATLPAEMLMSAEHIAAALGPRLAWGHPLAAPGRGPARYLPAADGDDRKVGFISAVSNDFCEDCNRVRVTARGDVRACLASRQSVSLRDLIRGGADDRGLAWAVHHALRGKDEGHRFLEATADEHQHVAMSLVGG